MFKLQTDYEPMGDQPQAIEKLTTNLQNGVKYHLLAKAQILFKTVRVFS